MRLIRYLYNIGFYLAIPFIFLYSYTHSSKGSAYRRRERFAYFNVNKHWHHGLWVHAASVGEVSASIPLIKAIQHRYSDLPIVFTTMTSTGSARVKAIFADRVFHTYFPYDVPTVVSRFLKKINPQAVMILETELWPNILYQCQRRCIPVMIANARLSEKSYRGYAKFPVMIKQMLDAITVLAVQAPADAERFIRLGMDISRMSVTNSLKFEIEVPQGIAQKAQTLRHFLGGHRPVWIAASTHPGENEQILHAHRQVLKTLANALLILVPRHPESFNAVYQLAIKNNFNTVRRSSENTYHHTTQVFLIDTMGELMLLFAASDLAFVGGSLVDIGGHNLLEPTSLGIATIIGPSHFNFAEVTQKLLDVHAAIQVNNSKELAAQVLHLLQDSNVRMEMGARGHCVIEQNRGALAAHLAFLEKILFQ